MAADRSDPDPNIDSPRIPGGFRAAFVAALAEVGLTVKKWQGINVICTGSDGEERSLSLQTFIAGPKNTEPDGRK